MVWAPESCERVPQFRPVLCYFDACEFSTSLIAISWKSIYVYILTMSTKELLKCKHPAVCLNCLLGKCPKLFPNSKGPLCLKHCMKRGYSYLEGVEELLCSLRQNNYEMHTFTNYPIWYEMIEDKLQISRYLSWTFCSCKNGKRKPDPDFYLNTLEHLEVDPANCIFVDDSWAIVKPIFIC
ncbi:hypothetical protein UlMin_044702 [Ulmus minor]